MNTNRGLEGREGLTLLVHVANYVPSLRPRAAAYSLNAYADAFGTSTVEQQDAEEALAALAPSFDFGSRHP